MNYYNYFTEIEEHFWKRRGAQIYLSPVDWALIATWQESGIPLEAVLAGIDRSFEKWESGRRRDSRRLRALVYCAPAVADAAEALAAAAVGATDDASRKRADAAGFTPKRIAEHARAARTAIAANRLLAGHPVTAELVQALGGLAASLEEPPTPPGAAPGLESIDRLLTVLDEKLLSLLLQLTPADEQTRMRAELERELAPHRRDLRAEQRLMIERQFLHRRMLERAGLPRLSLYFMAL